MTDLEIKDLLDYWAKEVEENAKILAIKKPTSRIELAI
jgi:hypothetical protein